MQTERKKEYRCASAFIKKQQLKNATTNSCKGNTYKTRYENFTLTVDVPFQESVAWKMCSHLKQFSGMFFSLKGTRLNKAYHKVCLIAAVYCIILWTSSLPTRLERSILVGSTAGTKLFPFARKRCESDPQSLFVIKILGPQKS